VRKEVVILCRLEKALGNESDMLTIGFSVRLLLLKQSPIFQTVKIMFCVPHVTVIKCPILCNSKDTNC
jgi:hypothetical protein